MQIIKIRETHIYNMNNSIPESEGKKMITMSEKRHNDFMNTIQLNMHRI